MIKNQKGFTLIEMLVVMLIISVLLILIVPNLTDQTENIDSKGCEALVAMVQAQADAYYLDNQTHVGSIDALASADYIEVNQKQCSEDRILTIDDGNVSVK